MLMKLDMMLILPRPFHRAIASQMFIIVRQRQIGEAKIKQSEMPNPL